MSLRRRDGWAISHSATLGLESTFGSRNPRIKALNLNLYPIQRRLNSQIYPVIPIPHCPSAGGHATPVASLRTNVPLFPPQLTKSGQTETTASTKIVDRTTQMQPEVQNRIVSVAVAVILRPPFLPPCFSLLHFNAYVMGHFNLLFLGITDLLLGARGEASIAFDAL